MYQAKQIHLNIKIVTIKNNIENENYRALDTLMSFQFYQTTPYKEFIEIIKKKKEYLVK